MNESNHTKPAESIGKWQESSHTPTPWHAEPNGVSTGMHVWGRKNRVADILEKTAKISRAECEANAAFIVRAANSHDALLAACKAAQPLMILAHAAGAKAGDAEWVKHFGDTLDAMSAAIAIAEGGAS